MNILLLVTALFGLVVPNGLFLYWAVYEFGGITGILENKLAVAFVLDAFLALGLLAYIFHKSPIGRYGWHWFVLLSLIGGLGFGLPVYWLLNQRAR